MEPRSNPVCREFLPFLDNHELIRRTVRRFPGLRWFTIVPLSAVSPKSEFFDQQYCSGSLVTFAICASPRGILNDAESDGKQTLHVP